jgi:hypothetical protein
MPPLTNPLWVKYPGDTDLHSAQQVSATIIDKDEKWGQLGLPPGWAKGECEGCLEFAGSMGTVQAQPPSQVSLMSSG